MKNEIEEKTIPAELEENPKTPLWQRPRFPLYFAVGVGFLIILMVAARFLIRVQLSDFSSETEVAEMKQKQQ